MSHAFAHPPPRPQSAWHPVFSCKSAEIKNRRSRCKLMEHVTLRQPCWRAISVGGRGSDEFVLPSCGNPLGGWPDGRPGQGKRNIWFLNVSFVFWPKIPTTTRNKNSARYLIIETTFWNYSCWYGYLYRSECNLKTTCASEFFKNDRYCTSLKYECDLKILKNSRVYVFPNCTLESVLLLIIIIWQASFPVKWRTVIGWEALSAVHYFPVM